MQLPTSRPIADYCKALIVCLLAAIGYRLAIVPLVEAEPVVGITVSEPEEDAYRPNLNGIFPADSWQAQTSMVLQAEWGVLLFQEWHEEAPGRWRVSPVSIVLRSKEPEGTASSAVPTPLVDDQQRKSDPIILDAPEGAIVELTEPLNMLGGGRPAIKGGQLVGDVRIYNLADTSLDAKRNSQLFDLRTRNVRIDNRQIRSAEAISLRIGDAILKGRDLTINLAAGTPRSDTNDSPLNALDTLELIYLDQLLVPLPDGPLWEPLPEALATNRVLADSPAEPPFIAALNIGCKGRVAFDFSQFALKMSEGVEIRHQWSRSLFDQFSCRELTLLLADPYIARREREQGGKPEQSPASMVRRIEAIGFPLEANISSLASRLQAGTLDIRAREGIVNLTGHQGPIDFQYNKYRFRVPTFQYQFDPEQPQRPGQLTCTGQGLINLLDPTIAVQSIRWSKSLQLFEREDGHYLWVDGEVRGQMRDGGTAGADDLLVLFQIPTDSEPARPEKLRARGNVFVDAAQLAVHTKSLTVLFEKVQQDFILPQESDAPRLNAATGPPNRFWIRTPLDKTSPDGAPSGTKPPVALPRPVLRGETLNAKLWMRNQDIVAQDLSVSQNVQLSHEMVTESGRLPLTYTGDSLRFATGLGEDQVQIVGSPARITLADGFFSGPLVVIQGRENRISIRDTGVFQMPSAFMPRPTAATNESPALHWISTPSCEFRGELTFDGQTVAVGPQVKMNGRLRMGEANDIWDIQADAPQLQLRLDRGIRVTDPASARTAAVERVSLIGEQTPVVITATQFTPDGQPLGRHQLQNSQLDFFTATGQLQGAGPGWYRSWIPSTQDSPMRAVAQPGSLLATHLIFNGGIEGNMQLEQLDFVRGVRIGISSVLDWSAMIDAATMSQLSLNQGTVDCDRLRLGYAQTSRPQGKLPFEIQALGGVAFRMLTERGLVDGTATRAAYDGGNDLFVLQGSPQRDAVVRNLSPTGQELFQVRLPEFILRSDTLEVDARVHGATVSQIPTTDRGR